MRRSSSLCPPSAGGRQCAAPAPAAAQWTPCPAACRRTAAWQRVMAGKGHGWWGQALECATTGLAFEIRASARQPPLRCWCWHGTDGNQAMRHKSSAAAPVRRHLAGPAAGDARMLQSAAHQRLANVVADVAHEVAVGAARHLPHQLCSRRRCKCQEIGAAAAHALAKAWQHPSRMLERNRAS